MNAPRWATALLGRLAPPDRVEDIVGDLEEAHRRRMASHGRVMSTLGTLIETADIAVTLLLRRWRRRHASPRAAPRDSATRQPRRVSPVSWLDFKLGLRMLVKYPGLTVVGGLAIAFGIAVGVGGFEFIAQVLHPTLPLDEGDRIVAIVNHDAAAGDERQPSVQDFVTWRDDMASVEDLGVFRSIERNLLTGEGQGEPAIVAEISASALLLSRVPALLGRTLVGSDEQSGASPVLMIGYDVWQNRFAGDSAVIGRTVQLGTERRVVVGVMPEGFAFPIDHGLWIPYDLNAVEDQTNGGPVGRVIGRLVPGVALDEAQAELTTIGSRVAADHPETHEHLRPVVIPYAESVMNLAGPDSLLLMSINLFLVMLLVLAYGNVALLMFARAAARENEIAVRTALGASRGRIVGQFFAEALVLGVVGAMVGLIVARAGLRWWLYSIGLLDTLPFWFRSQLSTASIVYATALTLLGAVIAGVVPALKVTASDVSARMRQSTAGAGGLRFGGVWTAVIVVQIALTVTFPVFAFFVQRDVRRIRAIDLGFPRHEFLSVTLEMDRDARSAVRTDTTNAVYAAQFRNAIEELKERLTANPAVSGVTFANLLPRMYHPHRYVEVDAGGSAPPADDATVRRFGPDPSWPGYRIASASIDVDFFKVLGTPILAGRNFHTGDVAAATTGAVIVNQSFVDRVLEGRNPIGRRVRYLPMPDRDGTQSAGAEPGPWYEIVGVVRDLAMATEPDPKVAGIYHPQSPGAEQPVHMAVHVRGGNPMAWAPSLRSMALDVDPNLVIDRMIPLDQIDAADLESYAFWFWLIVAGSSIAMILSLAGIYSVMAFTVARRTREIGIRVALGSNRSSIVLAILRRPLIQVALGVTAGAGVTGVLSYLVLGEALWPTGALVVAAYSILMMGVCLLACAVPTRRALTIQPTEALREE